MQHSIKKNVQIMWNKENSKYKKIIYNHHLFVFRKIDTDLLPRLLVVFQVQVA